MQLTLLCINYMQFLSMKLATVNPALEFNSDDLFDKVVRDIQITDPYLIVQLHFLFLIRFFYMMYPHRCFLLVIQLFQL